MPIFTIRTTSGREDVVIDMLESNVKSENLDIKSIFHPAEIKGYIFVEGSLGSVQKGMHGLMHAKGLIEKPVALQEIQHFLEQKKATIRVSEGDTVEIIGGPFRGERGEIKRVDKVKDEVTIELLEASIPIPVTIATEFIKIIKKIKSDEIERPAKHAVEEPVQEEKETTEPAAEPAAKEEESEEPSAFDLKALKEREEARTEKAGAGQKTRKMSFEEMKKEMDAGSKTGVKPAEPSETIAESTGIEQEEKEELKGGILEELEKEEREKKRKKIKDLEDLESGE